MTASHVPRTLLITGVAGMLGSHIARQAIRRGYRVRGLDVVGDPLSLRELDVHYVRGDVRSDAALEELMAGIDPAGAVLVHAASIISIRSRPDPTMWSTNVGGTAAVLRACTRHRVTRTVYVSSCHAVPEVPRGQWMTEVDDYDPDLVAGGEYPLCRRAGRPTSTCGMRLPGCWQPPRWGGRGSRTCCRSDR